MSRQQDGGCLACAGEIAACARAGDNGDLAFEPFSRIRNVGRDMG
jgi:hypothetical protein